MDGVIKCSACACFICGNDPYYRLTLQQPGQTAIEYVLCDDCTENLKQRINNGEMTEVGA